MYNLIKRIEMIKKYKQQNISYVYVLVADEFIKIGKANALNRISQMKYLYNFRLMDSFIIEIDITKSSVRAVESMLHKQFHNYKKELEVVLDGSTELFEPEVLEMIKETFFVTTKYLNGVSELKKINIPLSDLPLPNTSVETLYQLRNNRIDYSKMVKWMF
jgi:disulfide oxidoreductase YuzD